MYVPPGLALRNYARPSPAQYLYRFSMILKTESGYFPHGPLAAAAPSAVYSSKTVLPAALQISM
jgi:hypothetical protein